MTQKIDTVIMTRIAVVTAAFCILAPVSLAIPISPVPISLTTMVVLFSGFVLSYKSAVISYVLYILIGLMGMPVFSGFSGGPAKVVGPTGGYLLGMVFLVFISAYCLHLGKGKKNWYVYYVVGAVIGTAITYLFGTAWLVYSLKVTFMEGLFMGVIPFLPGDAVKMVLAGILGTNIRKALMESTGEDPID